ncbi:MAG: hypothetical protein KME13_25420 [Myxacorys californica WJT36-NPBG1]|jgi:hypothetical protein|nr:hypothetical protein [Myxacorys californica WJT36-NPBG1]
MQQNIEEVSTSESRAAEIERARAKNQAMIELLHSWQTDGDEHEQTESWEYLRQVLDHDRLSNRPLFP